MSNFPVVWGEGTIFPSAQITENGPLKFNALGFAVLIIFGLGALTVAGIGIGGLLHAGSLTNLGHVNSIIMLVIGGGSGIPLVLIGIVGFRNTYSNSSNRIHKKTTIQVSSDLEEPEDAKMQEQKQRLQAELEAKRLKQKKAAELEALGQLELESKNQAEAITSIQTFYRGYLARNKLKVLRQAKRAEVAAALIIQSALRGHQARLELTRLKLVKSMTVVDAKDSGLGWEIVTYAIDSIAYRELKGEEGMFGASSYVQEDYFKGNSIEPGLLSPELILIAKAANEIFGFIITAKRKTKSEKKYVPFSIPPDTGYVAYLAVDSTIKRSGIGTKLMLAAMRKTKELGKHYLTLEYIAEGLGVDLVRAKAKSGFYNSFTTRFGIPMEERDSIEVDRQLHVHPYYDLKDVDFDTISF